jgi:hypothetical protein
MHSALTVPETAIRRLRLLEPLILDENGEMTGRGTDLYIKVLPWGFAEQFRYASKWSSGTLGRIFQWSLHPIGFVQNRHRK